MSSSNNTIALTAIRSLYEEGAIAAKSQGFETAMQAYMSVVTILEGADKSADLGEHEISPISAVFFNPHLRRAIFGIKTRMSQLVKSTKENTEVHMTHLKRILENNRGNGEMFFYYVLCDDRKHTCKVCSLLPGPPDYNNCRYCESLEEYGAMRRFYACHQRNGGHWGGIW